MSNLSKKQEAALRAYDKHRSQRKAADSLGISRRAFRTRYDSALAKMNDTPVGFKTTKVNTDTQGLVTARTHKLAPETTDEVREGKIIKRSTLYGADGNVAGEWIIRKPEDEQADFMTAIEKMASDKLPSVPLPYVATACETMGDNLAFFPAIDEHLNVKLLPDVVGEDFGLDDAVELISERFKTIVARTPKTKKALFTQLGDAMHQNDHMNVTPASKHVLDSDKSFNTASDAVVALNRFKLDLLLQNYEEVDVISIAGNHDVDPAHWLSRCLTIAYENEPRININFDNTGTAAYEFGVNMLGFHHGHKMKPDVLAGAMTDRYRDIYGRTRMGYLHTGHVHHDSEKDTFGGFKWRSHRTIIPKDEFSFANGYISRQSMKSYIYDPIEGEVANFVTNLVPQ